MLVKPRHIHWCLFFQLTFFVFSFAPTESLASRYHVKSTGSRLSGPSNPSDWSDGNCYPTIPIACEATAIEDSVLLYREIHNLEQAVNLPQFLGNEDLDTNASDAVIYFSSMGRMDFNGSFNRILIKGLSFEGDGMNSNRPALALENNAGLLEQALIQNCVFSGLKGSDYNAEIVGGGAAIRADGNGRGARLEIRDCHFENNHTRGGGGAIFIADNYQVTISGSVFFNNFSDNGYKDWEGRGGGLFLKSNNEKSTLSLVECLFDRNKARGPGGALFIEDGSLTMISTTILENTSALGGTTPWASGAGLFMRGVGGHDQPLNLEMRDCDVLKNIGNLSGGVGSGDGGGVLVKGFLDQTIEVFVTGCTFERNYNHQGAGLYTGRFTTGEVERCSFRNNTAHSNGGASFKGGAFAANLGETIVYNYCEFIGNRAGFSSDGDELENGGRGGAFCTRLNPRAFFFNCTFLDNYTATNGQSDALFMWPDGGDFDDNLKRCRLINCLFYGVTGQDVQVNMLDNSFELVSHCAFEEGQFICPGVEQEGSVVLDGNPCSSLMNIHLITNSVCIDSALPIGLDEDLFGFFVPLGFGPDIGAKEYGYSMSPVETELGLPGLNLHSARVWPNPFNPKAQIGFSLETGMLVDVKIFDIRGALVKYLFKGYLEKGPKRIPWDGKDSEGQSVASGAYRAVIYGGDHMISKKMTLIR